jgi:galactose-1-phosphate uridylyltransferase
MDIPQPARVPMHTREYARQVQEARRNGRCFICRVVDRTHSYSHHVVYEDDDTIATSTAIRP